MCVFSPIRPCLLSFKVRRYQYPKKIDTVDTFFKNSSGVWRGYCPTRR